MVHEKQQSHYRGEHPSENIFSGLEGERNQIGTNNVPRQAVLLGSSQLDLNPHTGRLIHGIRWSQSNFLWNYIEFNDH